MHAKVYVWMPRSGLKHKIGWGHAAVKIKTLSGAQYYITWLPRGASGWLPSPNQEAGMRLGFAKIRDPKSGDVVDNPANIYGTALDYQADCKLMKMPANFTYDVPVIDFPGRRFGVSVHLMERFWKRLLALPPGHPRRRYARLSIHSNCAAVVVDALRAGGLDLFAKPPKNLIYQGTHTLVEWVQK